MSLHKHKFVSWELDSPRDSVTMNVLMGVQGSGKARAEGESQSQNVGTKGPPEVVSINPCLEQIPLDQPAQGHIQSSLEHLPGRRLRNLLGKPIPVLIVSFCLLLNQFFPCSICCPLPLLLMLCTSRVWLHLLCPLWTSCCRKQEGLP